MNHCWRCPRGRWSNGLKSPARSQRWRRRPHTDRMLNISQEGEPALKYFELYITLKEAPHLQSCKHIQTFRSKRRNSPASCYLCWREPELQRLRLVFPDLSTDTACLCMYRCIRLWMPPIFMHEHMLLQNSLVVISLNMNSIEDKCSQIMTTNTS